MNPFYCILYFAFSTITLCAAPFTMESAVQRALKTNPDLAAARLAIEEAQGRLRQAGLWSNPELETEVRPSVQGQEVSLSLGFMQKFPKTHRLRLEKAASQAELAIAEAEVRKAERALADAVRKVMVKWITLQAERKLKQSIIQNSREMAASAANLATRGEGSALEAAQFELESQQLELDLLQLDVTMASLLGEARQSMGLGATDTVEFTGNLPAPSLPKWVTPEIEKQPEFQAAMAKIQATNHQLALAESGKWGDFSIGVVAEMERTDDRGSGFENEGFLGIKFSIPLPLRNKNEGKIQEATASTLRAQKEADAIRVRIKAEAAAALGEMKACLAILNRTATVLIPKATKLQEQFEAAYKAGQPGAQLSDVLKARERHFTLEQASIEAQRTFHLARIRFETAIAR